MSILIVVELDGMDSCIEYQTNLTLEEWEDLSFQEQEEWRAEALEDSTTIVLMDDETNECI